MHLPLWALLGALLALGFACHDGAEHDGTREHDERDADVGSATDESQLDASDSDAADSPAAPDANEISAADDASTDAGSSDDASAPESHSSFESALSIEVNTVRITDELAADQVDYYVFPGKGGTFYEITTDNTTYSPDNVIALYDAQHNMIAANDDGPLWPGDGIDARLVVRLPADGLYYLRVEDVTTSADFFRQSFRLLYYHLSVREVSTDTPGYANARAANPTFLQDEKRGYRYVTVIDQLEGDKSVLSFTGMDGQALIARAHAGGNRASGSSLENGELVVTAADGHRLARIDRSMQEEFFRPPVSAGPHQITLSASGTLGPNPFFVLDLVLLPDNPREQNEAGNGVLAGAEAITLSRGTTGRGLLLSRLPADDVDYYRFSAALNQQMLISCEGETSGSGVRGLHAELRDESDKVLATMAESDDALMFTNPKAGNLFLRLSSGTPPANMSSVEPWVRCVVVLA